MLNTEYPFLGVVTDIQQLLGTNYPGNLLAEYRALIEGFLNECVFPTLHACLGSSVWVNMI